LRERNTDTNPDPYTYVDTNGHTHSDAIGDRDRHTYAYAVRHSHDYPFVGFLSDTDAYAVTYPHADSNPDFHAHADADANAKADLIADADAYALVGGRARGHIALALQPEAAAVAEDGYHRNANPPIVDERLWWAAQDRLDARRKLPNRQHQQTWPLQARVTCAADGCSFKCRRNNKDGPRIYSCVARERCALGDDSARCNAPRLDAERLEAGVVWYVQGMLSNAKAGRTAVEDYLAKLQALQDEASRGLEPLLVRLNTVAEQESRLDELTAVYFARDAYWHIGSRHYG
jgi:hypothetical protein